MCIYIFIIDRYGDRYAYVDVSLCADRQVEVARHTKSSNNCNIQISNDRR